MILIPPLISALEAPIPPTPAIITTRSANTTAAILGISSFFLTAMKMIAAQKRMMKIALAGPPLKAFLPILK